jgi:Ni,Fe-hydrogenase III large subunit
MQRAAADMSDVHATSMDQRPWLRHNAWPEDFHPLIERQAPTVGPATDEHYPFVRVQGDGVHEIAVGPVHAGTIEPGHFRFSVVGEKVLKLEERLGYTHKGIERRFTELPALAAHRLAARISGDSAVAFSWAYAQALEGVSDVMLPPRAACLRGIALECERMSNHLGDLGALGNDAGFGFALSQFSRLKETLLRTLDSVFGQRYLMDFIVPGGVRADIDARSLELLIRTLQAIESEVASLRTIYDEHAGLRDRFSGAGTVTPELAARLGLAGLAGRASGQNYDLRSDMPCPPYSELTPRKVSFEDGDVAARVAIRFEELLVSMALVKRIAAHLPTGAHAVAVPVPEADRFGMGLIEGWRGAVLVALETGPGGSIRRCHPHDPSWQNWPVLEHAIIGNIVPDFPLINKSFNLAYSGHDL